jgi:hypothetical protein
LYKGTGQKQVTLTGSALDKKQKDTHNPFEKVFYINKLDSTAANGFYVPQWDQIGDEVGRCWG